MELQKVKLGNKKIKKKQVSAKLSDEDYNFIKTNKINVAKLIHQALEELRRKNG